MHFPPHYWVTVDKGIPSRNTNQTALIVALDQNGTPSPIPVTAPKIYFDFQGCHYSILAKQLINMIEITFLVTSCPNCHVVADDPYQASGFQRQLYKMVLIPKIHKDLASPIT